MRFSDVSSCGKTVGRWLTIFALLLAICSCDNKVQERVATQRPMTKLNVQFGWLFDAHHLGFLLAKVKGYYEQEGLDVTLLPGGLDSSPTRAVATGAAQIGQISGPEQLIAAGREVLPIVGIAAFHRRSPHALISLSRNPIRGPADLPGKTVAVAYGDAAELYLRDFMVSNGISPDKVKLVPFRFDMRPLISGQVDAVTGFSTDQPITLENSGFEPIVIRYSETGAKGYGYMFVASKNEISNNSNAIAAFIRASRRGWEEAFAKPEESLALVQASILPSSDLAIERRKLDAVRSLMLDPSKKLSGWEMDVAIMEAAAARLQNVGSPGRVDRVDMLIDNRLVRESN